LKKYTAESYEFETRINAMQALQRLNIFDAEIAANMLQGFFHWNRKISSAARESLTYFHKQILYSQIISREILKRNYSEKQIQKVNKCL